MTKSELRQIIKEEIQALPWDKIIRAEINAYFQEKFSTTTKKPQQENYAPQRKPQQIPQQQRRPLQQKQFTSNPMLNKILNETAANPVEITPGGNPMFGQYAGGVVEPPQYMPQYNPQYPPNQMPPQYMQQDIPAPLMVDTSRMADVPTEAFTKDFSAILKRSLEISNKT